MKDKKRQVNIVYRFVTLLVAAHILEYTYELQRGGYDESESVCHVVATAAA